MIAELSSQSLPCESDCGVKRATCWLRKRKGKSGSHGSDCLESSAIIDIVSIYQRYLVTTDIAAPEVQFNIMGERH